MAVMLPFRGRFPSPEEAVGENQFNLIYEYKYFFFLCKTKNVQFYITQKIFMFLDVGENSFVDSFIPNHNTVILKKQQE